MPRPTEKVADGLKPMNVPSIAERSLPSSTDQVLTGNTQLPTGNAQLPTGNAQLPLSNDGSMLPSQAALSSVAQMSSEMTPQVTPSKSELCFSVSLQNNISFNHIFFYN